MAYRRIGDKPLSKPMPTQLSKPMLTRIYAVLGGDELNGVIAGSNYRLASAQCQAITRIRVVLLSAVQTKETSVKLIKIQWCSYQRFDLHMLYARFFMPQCVDQLKPWSSSTRVLLFFLQKYPALYEMYTIQQRIFGRAGRQNIMVYRVGCLNPNHQNYMFNQGKLTIESRRDACQIWLNYKHNSDVIMGTIASQITSLTIVSSAVYPGADQRKHQISTSLTSNAENDLMTPSLN